MPTSEEDVFTTWTSQIDNDSVSVICLCGELDASTVPTLLADVKSVISQRKDVIMDVHLLSYVDSTGVAALLSTRSALIGGGNKMCLVGCHGLLTKVIQLIRVENELRCFEDVDTAVAQFRAGVW